MIDDQDRCEWPIGDCVMGHRIRELEAERDEALNQLDSARHSVEVLEKHNARLWAALEVYASKLEEHEIECPVLTPQKENLNNDD